MRVLSYNIRYDGGHQDPNGWLRRALSVFETIQKNRPALVGLQEVLPNQRRDLEDSLSEYNWFGRGRNLDGGGEQCAIGVHRNLTVLDSGTFWLSETPDQPASVGWDACLTRICSWVEVQINDQSLHFANAHFDHLGSVAQLQSAQLLVERLKTHTGPVVLVGDFNCQDNEPALVELTRHFSDGYRNLNPDNRQGTYHNFGQLPAAERPRIDYILASSHLSWKQATILEESGPYSSDHFAVLGELDWE